MMKWNLRMWENINSVAYIFEKRFTKKSVVILAPEKVSTRSHCVYTVLVVKSKILLYIYLYIAFFQVMAKILIAAQKLICEIEISKTIKKNVIEDNWHADTFLVERLNLRKVCEDYNSQRLRT